MAEDKDDKAGPAPAFAAYDKTLQRFVGGVHRGDKARDAAGKSPEAEAARKDGHRVEIRQVQG